MLMPILSIFLGIVIRMFHKDHNPPHFHVQHGEYWAVIEVKTGKVLGGRLPPRVLRLVQEWRKQYQARIEKAWIEVQDMKAPSKIPPLE